MNKIAEEAGMKAYPVRGKWVGNQYGYWDGDINMESRQRYIEGYKQAEKDLALTWEDVNLIDSILIDMQDEGVERYGGLRQYYEEALKRFNEQREKK